MIALTMSVGNVTRETLETTATLAQRQDLHNGQGLPHNEKGEMKVVKSLSSVGAVHVISNYLVRGYIESRGDVSHSCIHVYVS